VKKIMFGGGDSFLGSKIIYLYLHTNIFIYKFIYL
jgi:hypothetical protein